MALALIDKQDTFEIIRDQLAGILAIEIANQKSLAVAASKDPDLWDIDIFLERFNPFQLYLNDADRKIPMANIWLDNLSPDQSASNLSERSKFIAVYNIDCYANAIAEEDGVGHKASDQEASFTLHRTIKIIRNILFSPENIYLQITDKTINPWTIRIRSIDIYQPEFNGVPVQSIKAGRISLEICFNEFLIQPIFDNLEFINIMVMRQEDGKIIAETNYNFT